MRIMLLQIYLSRLHTSIYAHNSYIYMHCSLISRSMSFYSELISIKYRLPKRKKYWYDGLCNTCLNLRMESGMFQRDHNPNKDQKVPTRMDLQHSETCRQVVCQLIIIVYTESYDIFDISICIWMFHID